MQPTVVSQSKKSTDKRWLLIRSSHARGVLHGQLALNSIRNYAREVKIFSSTYQR